MRFTVRIILGLAVMAAVCRAEIMVEARVAPSGDLALTWSGVAANYGYAVSEAADLQGAAWRYAGAIDTWPQAGTNATLSVGSDAGCLRVVGVNRGRLVSSVLQRIYLAFEINIVLAAQGLPMSAVWDVAVYEVTYETFDHRGLSTVATGALAIPVGTLSVPMVSFQHGTMFRKNEAPSIEGSLYQLVGVALATDGYIVVLPDYCGLGGASPGLHLYCHARSEAVSAVDLIRAGRDQVGVIPNLTWNGQLFITGYSQGGHATLALQRELEQNHAAELPLTASAPMAGPHDMSGVMSLPLSQPIPYANGEYIPYLVLSYNAIYPLFDQLSDVLVPPYDTTLPPLFDGLHSSGEVSAAMPAIPREIFKPAYVTDFTNNPDNPLRIALAANDTSDWAPTVPIRLYHCSGDTVVPFANSQVAQSNLVANGASSVLLFDMGPTLDHDDGVMPCSLAAKAWFDSLKLP